MVTEDQEQMLFVQWFRRQYPSVMIWHIPNGGHRHPAVAAKMKALGVIRGVPDLQIPAWNLWVEMKRAQGGKLSQDQKVVIAYLESIGDTVVVGHGFEDARTKVLTSVNRKVNI